MSPKGALTMLLILIGCSMQVHCKFRGLTPSLVGVDAHGSPDHHDKQHHDDQHGHHQSKTDDHQNEQHAHHESAHAQHTGQQGNSNSAKSVAIGLMAFVTLTPLVLSMLMTQVAGGQLSYFTIRMVDMATSIFLAVLWFSALGEVLHIVFPHTGMMIGIVLALVLYVLTLLIAYTLRANKFPLFIFCGCAAHFIAFATIQVATEAQQRSGKLVDAGGSHYMSFGFCILLLAVFAIISIVCFYSFRKLTKSLELNVAIDELELDIAGLVVSFAIMQAVRHALSGHYPSAAHFLLQFASNHDDTGHGHATTELQRLEMLICSIVFTFLACLALWMLQALRDRTHYWVHKLLAVVEVVLVMCAAWGYLLWGAMQFTETNFHGDKMYGNMVFAVAATVISLLIIVVLAFATNDSGRFASAKGYARLFIMAVSLVTAWSWEHCFHVAIDIVAEEYQVGYGGLVPKIASAVVIPLVILPGYVVFLKPIVLEKTEKFDAENEDTEVKDLAEMGIEPETLKLEQ